MSRRNLTPPDPGGYDVVCPYCKEIQMAIFDYADRLVRGDSHQFLCRNQTCRQEWHQGEFQAIVARVGGSKRGVLATGQKIQLLQNVSGESTTIFHHKSSIQVRSGDEVTMMSRKASRGWWRSKWTGEWEEICYIYNNSMNKGWEI